MDLETFEWLLSGPGQALLAEATALQSEGVDPIRAGEMLRRTARPEQAAAATSQAALRARARTKFGPDADRMYFTREALEQATRVEIARHRARRVMVAARATTGASGTEPSVVDLCCGIGGDLAALARTGLTTAGVDLDPLRVAIARANLAALDLPAALMAADATALDLTAFGFVFLDPARRSAHGRVFDVDAYQPPWSFVEAVLARGASPPACVKVAPGIPHERIPEGVEAEWVSFRGEVKEAALWSSRVATVGRRATVVGTHGLASLTDESLPPETLVGPVGDYLLEPDGAVIRAGLVTAAAARSKAWLGDPHIAYLFADQWVASPFTQGYLVLEQLPYAEKRLRAALRERNVGRLTIKKRGVAVVPEQLRTRLALRGDDEATLVLTRVSGKGTALLVQPLA